ncbi:MAG TPA: lecithin retinol acyltransferase family protein [Chitinophagaceae bacterium]|jgi:hypothetical protein|nr:lecithin retinol acyltransferase family protein [Chitinophagaceae bacterium]
MDSIQQVVFANGLQPADVIVLRKKILGMVNHYAVFLGWGDDAFPVFAANYNSGTQFISRLELEKFLHELEPQKIERFIGSEIERQNAVRRGLSEIGKNDYDFFLNNCEHYKNFVQTGKKFSKQSEDAGKAILVASLIVVLFRIFR